MNLKLSELEYIELQALHAALTNIVPNSMEAYRLKQKLERRIFQVEDEREKRLMRCTCPPELMLSDTAPGWHHAIGCPRRPPGGYHEFVSPYTDDPIVYSNTPCLICGVPKGNHP